MALCLSQAAQTGLCSVTRRPEAHGRRGVGGVGSFCGREAGRAAGRSRRWPSRVHTSLFPRVCPSPRVNPWVGLGPTPLRGHLVPASHACSRRPRLQIRSRAGGLAPRRTNVGGHSSALTRPFSPRAVAAAVPCTRRCSAPAAPCSKAEGRGRTDGPTARRPPAGAPKSRGGRLASHFYSG